MSVLEPLPGAEIAPEFARVAARRVLIFSPTIRYRLGPGDRALVAPGDSVIPGMPIAERTPDAELVDAGKLIRPDDGRLGNNDQRSFWAASDPGSPPRKDEMPEGAGSSGRGRPPMAIKPIASMQDRRRAPAPGKWWVGGNERRGRTPKGKQAERVGGTLLFETRGGWRAAAGERHEIVESPVAGVVREARNCVEVTIDVSGAALPGAVAAGVPSRGYLDVPRLTDGELWVTALDVARSGAVVVAGSRITAQAISRARAVSIRGLVAGSVGEGELRDLQASELRQRASLAPSVPFGLIALDGHQRRPIATPILALLAALAGREVAIVTDPPLLVFDVEEVPLPDLPPDWIRARSGPHAGREGRWLRSAGLYRFRGGIYLEAEVVRFVDEIETTTVPVSDLERFVF